MQPILLGHQSIEDTHAQPHQMGRGERAVSMRHMRQKIGHTETVLFAQSSSHGNA